MRRVQILVLAFAAALCGATTASAAPEDPFQFQYFIDGASLPARLAEPKNVAVNHDTGNVLVLDQGSIKQLDADGDPVDFPALGSPELFIGTNGYLVVDNFGGPTQGNFYLFENAGTTGGYFAFHADGSPIGKGGGGEEWFGPGHYIPPGEGTGENIVYSCGGGVAPNGNVWFAGKYHEFVELTPSGTPTGKSGTLGGSPEDQKFAEGGCALVFDGLGNIFVQSGEVDVFRFSETDLSFQGNTGLTTRLNAGAEPFAPYFTQLAVDPASADVYMSEDRKSKLGVNEGKIFSVPHTDPPEEKSQTLALGGLANAKGFAFDATGQTLYVSEGPRLAVFHREPPRVPRDLAPLTVERVRSEGVVLGSSFIPGGAPVTYRFEYGTDTSYGSSNAPLPAPVSHYRVSISGALSGLQPDTTYHVRLAATNEAGTTYGPDVLFHTYARQLGGPDLCSNALARKQTGARQLPDCRAYELVSSGNTGGYDVESSLAPGQTPFPGYPLAEDRVLYAVHDGAIPGPWNATNRGPDPYLATRTAEGWVTDYEGLPADLNPQAGSFSSALGEADQRLGRLAFAGPGLCSPCFDEGLETGIPVRLPGGQMVQGMDGSLAGSVPASAKPEGKVAKYFSGDGTKLVFGSEYAFEPGANPGGLTVYKRDLSGGTTEIVSTDADGNALTGSVSELDVSGNGSRVVVGEGVSTDSEGNEYVHPYLHIAGTAGSVDLAPLATSGVLFAGMTSDGSKVFFTSVDQLTPSDTDASADLYEADVDNSGALELTALTADNDSDACDPVANANGEHWNSTAGVADCSAVAISGGGGVASATGAVYFLSPETFGGNGAAGQPNLYVAMPGESVSFVATLEPDNPLVLDSVTENAVRRTGDFQTSTDGQYAAFRSALPLSGVDTHEFLSVFRYAAEGDQLDCTSCELSGTTEAGIAAEAELPPAGLGLTGDGRVFFTTKAQLVLEDANARSDVYEWTEGRRWLISSGSGPFDSALLTISADGEDAFFFTHETLAPAEDHNGATTKIYDARTGGGFFRLPPAVPCQASDECHGASSPKPGPPDIKSSGKTSDSNVRDCPKKRVKRHGRCVKKHHKKRGHSRKHGAKRSAGTNGKRGGRDA